MPTDQLFSIHLRMWASSRRFDSYPNCPAICLLTVRLFVTSSSRHGDEAKPKYIYLIPYTWKKVFIERGWWLRWVLSISLLFYFHLHFLTSMNFNCCLLTFCYSPNDYLHKGLIGCLLATHSTFYHEFPNTSHLKKNARTTALC